jgi:hypothetical protein
MTRPPLAGLNTTANPASSPRRTPRNGPHRVQRVIGPTPDHAGAQIRQLCAHHMCDTTVQKTAPNGGHRTSAQAGGDAPSHTP